MKTILIALSLAPILFGCACLSKKKVAIPEAPSVCDYSQCKDSLYSQKKIISEFAEVLNNQIPDSLLIIDFSYDSNNRPIKFFIYDLTDTTNNSRRKMKSVDFCENHVYHFSPILYPISFSNIAFLDKGNVFVFKAINCNDSRDSIAEVLSFLAEKLRDYPDKDNVLYRVANYRRFGYYVRTDPQSELICK